MEFSGGIIKAEESKKVIRGVESTFEVYKVVSLMEYLVQSNHARRKGGTGNYCPV